MRQIKFRAWDSEMQNMYTPGDNYTNVVVLAYDKAGALTEFEVGQKDYEWDVNGVNQYDFSPEDKAILMQFTGLLDSKGKEIYEGDILEFADMHNGTGVIEFVGNGYWVTDNQGKHHLPTNRRVIGNIYQNPELIPL